MMSHILVYLDGRLFDLPRTFYRQTYSQARLSFARALLQYKHAFGSQRMQIMGLLLAHCGLGSVYVLRLVGTNLSSPLWHIILTDLTASCYLSSYYSR